ncbi:hypothetical protein APY94_11115 [Thermococcus celericrescens]|uniref:Uncharacterized protein n=1 Tax=Thermococcus celericrescens TaxID=227598 RepID=A0A100XVZ8_9EURY|nr:hypothetical protein [Thermococcus celericrescens]KUH32057.1 hypothetical protein APY94_11115 [Thermococcus celericrescens]
MPGRVPNAVARVAYFDGASAVFLVKRDHGRRVKKETVRGWNPWIPVPYVLIPEGFKGLVERAYREKKELSTVFVLDATDIEALEKEEYEFKVSLSGKGAVYSVRGYNAGESLVDVLGIPFKIEGLPPKEWVSARGKKLLVARAEMLPSGRARAGDQ